MSEGEIILGSMIGMVSYEKAKIWFYGTFDKGGNPKAYCHVFNEDKTSAIPNSPFEFIEVSKTPYDNHGVSGKSYVAGISFPTDGEEFWFGINYDGINILDTELKYKIKRFPEKGDIDFSFGLISCHKAFKSTSKHEDVTKKMWKILYDKMMEEKSSFLIQAGDQIYCDDDNNAWGKSKNTNDENEMLRFYRDVYLDSWAFPEVQKVMQKFPQYMIWDDHEITNGWGAKKEHRKEYIKIFEAARQAYVEFQDSHNPPSLKDGELYYAFHYGNAAFLVMDIRGHRDINLADGNGKSPLVGEEQWKEIKEWIESDKVKNSKVLFVITSVPVVHLSRSFGSLGWIKIDIADQWSTKENKHERRKLRGMLYNWSGDENKPVIILGGDVHVGTEICIVETEDKKRTINQITSSPITNKPAWFLDFLLAFISSRFKFHLKDNHVWKVRGRVLHRHRRWNFAIIKVSYENNDPKIELHMYRKGKTEPKVRQICFGENSECYRKYCKDKKKLGKNE